MKCHLDGLAITVYFTRNRGLGYPVRRGCFAYSAGLPAEGANVKFDVRRTFKINSSLSGISIK
ncbi:hypothetical protein CKA32_001194 [Geitlerinema sp. FC II]|nr:hypothetical protein CKA32_001194 [Geitlerinema sp. FC II]